MTPKKIIFTLALVFVALNIQPTLDLFTSSTCPLRPAAADGQFPDDPRSLLFAPANAIPAFARKYGASCLKCHTAYPQLNPFGKAFKKNGLRFPGEGVVFEPNSMKLEAMGEDVTPGDIPLQVPFSINVLSQFVSRPNDTTFNKKLQFQHLFGQAGIIAAGTLGKHFSLWVGLNVAGSADLTTGSQQASIGIERIYGIYRPFDDPYLLIRFGSFEPSILSISDHRSLLGPYLIASGHTVGDNGFSFEPNQQGVEFSGIAAKRFGYYLGVVEGGGNQYNEEKDFYGRVEYKFGGLRLTGETAQDSTTIDTPWRDDSITVGAYGYLGFATIASTLASQDDRFFLFGGDLDINYWNFLINVGYVGEDNNRPILKTPNRSTFTHHIFSEITYVYHWLLPAIRYEVFSGDLEKDHHLTLGCTFLVAPNIRTFIRGKLTSTNNSGLFKDPEFRGGLSLAF